MNSKIDRVTGELEPECERLVRTIAELGPIDLSNRESWNLRLTEAERQAGNDVWASFGGAPFIAIHMGGKESIKDWGVGNWRALMSTLAEEYKGFGLLIVGAAEDRGRARETQTRWPWSTVNACGLLTPRETAAALCHASMFIGHDSGPLHLAVAMDVKCVGIFGEFNKPRKWHPYGRNQKILHSLTGMKDVTVREVIQAANTLLSQDEELKSFSNSRNSFA